MNARTSQSHPLQIDTLGPVGRGRLGLTFCPGKYDPHADTGFWARDLDNDLRALTDWGATTVVTLMEAHELDLLRVPGLGDRVFGMGLSWWHLPIVDGGVPDARFEQAWNRAGEDLRRRLVAGEGIVLHCRGGLGRTGTVAARLLIEFGETPESALFRVRRARAGTVENRLQEEYLRGLLEVQGVA
jgi:ADP-ribosyl-[dinitrogen reductase] hydrolase